MTSVTKKATGVSYTHDKSAQPIWIIYVAVANQTTNIQLHGSCHNLIPAVAVPSI
jgi:hypothetical protein